MPMESDLLDHSQNAIPLVKTWTVNINTSQASIWVWYFNGWYFAINNSWILSYMQYNWTFSVRIKTSPTNVIFSKNSEWWDLWLWMPFDTSKENWWLARWMKQSAWQSGDLWTRNWTAYNWNWHLVTYTYEHSSWMRKIYCDWVLLASSSNYVKMWSQGTSYRIGKNPTEPDFRFYWYMSKLIIENKIRDISEISDYYQKTKKFYWIS